MTRTRTCKRARILRWVATLIGISDHVITQTATGSLDQQHSDAGQISGS